MTEDWLAEVQNFEKLIFLILWKNSLNFAANPKWKFTENATEHTEPLINLMPTRKHSDLNGLHSDTRSERASLNSMFKHPNNLNFWKLKNQLPQPKRTNQKYSSSKLDDTCYQPRFNVYRRALVFRRAVKSDFWSVQMLKSYAFTMVI